MIEKIIIIEDEKLNADRLKRLIKEINPNIVILAVLDSVEDTVDWFLQNDMPDVALMDVRLSDGISFNIFDKVEVDCPIIFTTAYDEYAVQAFKSNSVDYILKPVEKSELFTALKKAEDRESILKNIASIEQLVNFIKPKAYRSRFLTPFRDGFQTVFVNDVSCIYVEMKITKARLKSGKAITISQSMDELETQLDPKIFFRANRQFFIHIDSVKQVINHFNRKLKVVLNDVEFEIIVSREKANLLKDWLDS